MARRSPSPSLLPVEFGRREDGKPWISFGPPREDQPVVIWPGTVREAGDLALFINIAAQALRAVQDECRSGTIDVEISGATGDLVDRALAALGGVR